MLYMDVRPGDRLNIGHEGENLARTVRFDIALWQMLYGEGTVSLLHQRRDDELPYPCEVRVEGNVVEWPVTAADTARRGATGKYELQYRVGEKLVKSSVGFTDVYGALVEAAAEPPEPQKNWVDQILRAGAEAENAARRAEAATTRQPYPNADTGTWWVWDAEAGEYVDSGEAYQGEGSGGTVDAVLCTEQELTAEQQAQARENIGAQIADFVVNMVGDGTENELAPDKTWAELTEAYLAGRRLSCYYNGREYDCVAFYENEEAHFVYNELPTLTEQRIYFVYSGKCYIGVSNASHGMFPVQSVNGKTGAVKLTAEDVGAVATDDLQSAIDTALAQAKASGEFDGKDGQDGADGQDGYTPVRGEDYWTEADKTEIKSYVDDAILGGAW